MKKGGGKSGHVLKNAPQYCEVNVISDGGLRVSLEGDGSSSPLPRMDTTESQQRQEREDDATSDMASCVCFSRKFI